MHILIIDKDSELRALVRTRVEARGYTIREESITELALRYLTQESVDLILLSTDMEPIDGKLLIEWIRKTPFLSSVPVIMLAEEDQIVDLVLSQKRGFDDFLIKPFNPMVLQLRITMNVERAQKRIEANALTQLPGNPSIERTIQQKIDREDKFSVLYLDINNFKAFNDRYGFKQGDDVIRNTAKALVQVAVTLCGEDDYFVGHIGGDDFVVILDPEYEVDYAKMLIAEFDRLVPTYYKEEDRSKGRIRVMNRKGEEESFPLMSISVAACTNLYRPYQSLGEIAQDAAEVKKFLKSQSGSHYLRDRRSAPVEDFEEAAEVLTSESPIKQARSKIDPLGRTLLNAGLITEEQLSVALKKNAETGKRLGEVLIGMRAVRSEDVGRMLEQKLNIPYVNLITFRPSRDILRLFTLEFIKSKRVIPLESNEEGLRLAMCDPFDIRTIDAIERITRLKPVPCLALEDEFGDFLERHFSNDEDSKKERMG